MLAMFGDGTTCPCTHCRRELDFKSIEADRIIPGGSYKRSNIQPSCGPCNRLRGDSPITPYTVNTAHPAIPQTGEVI
jgi:5-methylcytosine-specific restriction endonuclease McrA